MTSRKVSDRRVDRPMTEAALIAALSACTAATWAGVFALVLEIWHAKL